MDKRYQVFVSSTYEDLKEERAEVMQALLELDCIPAGMELFPASSDDQWTLIKKVIDDCDYYLLIIGGRYGSTNDDGKSYTQMEFEYALETGKPIISFLPQNPEKIEAGKTDKDSDKEEKLNQFKELAKRKMIKYWENAADLGSKVSRSMIKLIKEFPSEGWVKSGSAIDEKSVHEISKLQKEISELRAELNNVATVAPKGSEKFAQGDDFVRISYNFVGIEWVNYSSKRYNCNNSDEFSWNDLFTAVAPSMINECTDYAFRKNLNTFIAKYSTLEENKEFQNFDDVENFEISKDSYDLIKVQFRALGLICLSEKKRTASDNQTYWKLTPYGDYLLTQLMAVKKENNSL